METIERIEIGQSGLLRLDHKRKTNKAHQDRLKQRSVGITITPADAVDNIVRHDAG